MIKFVFNELRYIQIIVEVIHVKKSLVVLYDLSIRIVVSKLCKIKCKSTIQLLFMPVGFYPYIQKTLTKLCLKRS